MITLANLGNLGGSPAGSSSIMDETRFKYDSMSKIKKSLELIDYFEKTGDIEHYIKLNHVKRIGSRNHNLTALGWEKWKNFNTQKGI